MHYLLGEWVENKGDEIMELNWREIFDCKMPGENIQDTQLKAANAGYRYLYHNGRVFKTSGLIRIDCIKIKENK